MLPNPAAFSYAMTFSTPIGITIVPRLRYVTCYYSFRRVPKFIILNLPDSPVPSVTGYSLALWLSLAECSANPLLKDDSGRSLYHEETIDRVTPPLQHP